MRNLELLELSDCAALSGVVKALFKGLDLALLCFAFRAELDGELLKALDGLLLIFLLR